MGKNPAEKAKEQKTETLKKAPKKKKSLAAVEKPSVRACRIKSCKRKYRAKGYCKAHYRMWRHGAYSDVRYKRCHDRGGCLKPMARNRFGFCEEHYQSYYVKGIVATKPVSSPAKTEEKKEAVAS